MIDREEWQAFRCRAQGGLSRGRTHAPGVFGCESEAGTVAAPVSMPRWPYSIKRIRLRFRKPLVEAWVSNLVNETIRVAV